MTKQSPADVVHLLRRILPEDSIKARLIDRIAYASDAGFYHLVPIAVLQPATEEEVTAIFSFSKEYKIPLTFRAGGTSLSGQSITEGLLVDLSRFWTKVAVQEGGEYVLVQPGVTGALVNHSLLRYGRKIGPDPASIHAAMMGGIIANNASGMCCGVLQNSYHTLRHARFILPNGKLFDTRNGEEQERFEKECPELSQTILKIRQHILQDEALLQTIRSKYQIKNTVGYGLNAFIDFEQSLQIFAHLLVGSEGTLAFISEAVLETVPDYRHKATGILFFPTIYAACAAISLFSDAGAKAIELMDRAALRSVEHVKGVPSIVKELPAEAAALLIEFQANEIDEVLAQLASMQAFLPQLGLLEAPQFSQDPITQALYWKVRKGMFPSVGAVRARGTTVILEDVAVPVPFLGNAISDLQLLFKKYQYDNAIIFGHARDGNIHFVVTQAFDTPEEIHRYDLFIREVVELIVKKYNGSLKAEHGTGRNMAPFVETEWGPSLYALMKEIKQSADPDGLLNPGVIINERADAHILHLKQMPQVEEEVDTCIECGFCEQKCPSRSLTLTPRRRIVVRRALRGLEQTGERRQHKELLQQFQYDGLDTCAVDGLCATSCPVDIDTGKLVKRLRAENHGKASKAVANWAGRNFSFTLATTRILLRTGVTLNRVFGKKFMHRTTKLMRGIVPSFPLWSSQLHPAPSLRKLQPKHRVGTAESIVYFPACINRLMGDTDRSSHVAGYFSSVAMKAGINLFIPPDLNGACCGQIFSSKGYPDAYREKANEFIEQLWSWTDEGKRPVVIDFSSCVYTVLQSAKMLTEINRIRLAAIRILETVEFIREFVIPRAAVIKKKETVVIHPVCSLEKMGLQSVLLDVAGTFAEKVIVPEGAGCCGMAGDRGFLFPELTSSACAPEAENARKIKADGYYATSKTCEIALSEAVGENYYTIMRLVDECLESVPGARKTT